MTTTPRLGLTKPPDGDTAWGDGYRANMDILDAAFGGSPTQIRVDYAGRTDDSPVYLGQADPTAFDTDLVWTVTMFTYDGDRITASEVRTGVAWTDRTTVF